MKEFVTPEGQAIIQRRQAKGFPSQKSLTDHSRKLSSELRKSTTSYLHVSLDRIKEAEQSKDVGLWVVESIATLLECDVRDLLPKYGLIGCQLDFAEQHSKCKPGGILKFSSIAIDLACGWENIAAAVELSRAKHTQFQLLMLTPDPGQLPPDAPGEVRAWSQGAAAHYQLIQGVLRTFRPNKHVSMEFKHYASLPTVHGMRVDYYTIAPRYYVSECSHRPGELEIYEWGEGKYMIADRMPNRTYSGYRQLMDRFDQRFQELWDRLPTNLRFDSMDYET